jgi:ABC transporter with metal-binding/Fe-S-binding domain ATP-binding protein
MFHVPNVELTSMQAKAIGLPLIQNSTRGEKEEEVKDLENALSSAKERFGIEGVVTGGIRSAYQGTRISAVCQRSGLCCFNPLWHSDEAQLLRTLVKEGFVAIISGVFAFPLDRSYLGKQINDDMVEKLIWLKEKYGVNPAGEGGEIETTVLDAPFFKKRIEILESEISYRNNSGIFRIKKARLVEKY